ncbi:MAG: transposase [Nitrospirales bacterium]|nr:MAG: transposase [Nitrospirales bacterium]
MFNLRKSTGYLRHRQSVEKTRPTRSRIGERRKRHPAGQPGFLRIDTVPQEDWDKQKWVYPINAVDAVTQFQVVCTLEKISEAYLLPALEQLLQALPFMIQGLHSDNGSEYINRRVAALLGKLLIDFTNPAPARPMTMPWSKGRMWRLCEHSLAIATFHNAGPRAHQCLQSEAPHTLSELSSAMLLSGDPDGSEGQSTEDLSLRNDDDALCQARITPAGGIG